MQFVHVYLKDHPPLMQIHRTSFLDIEVTITWPFTADQTDREVYLKKCNVKFSAQGHSGDQWLPQCHCSGPWEQVVFWLWAHILFSFPSHSIRIGQNFCNFCNSVIFSLLCSSMHFILFFFCRIGEWRQENRYKITTITKPLLSRRGSWPKSDSNQDPH